MIERIKEWLGLLESKWWAIILVYVLILISSFSTIWVLIEPLDVPEKLKIFSGIIDRRLIHISSAVVIASHLTLILDLVLRWKHSSPIGKSTSSLAITGEMISAFQASKLCPKRKDLIIERVAMKDGTMSKEAFANRVLWALHCKEINERFARELLRGSFFCVHVRSGYVFTLVKEESPN